MPIDYVKDLENGNIKAVYIGEICSECGKARMLHPQIYIYTCPYCRYSYMIEPCASPFSRGIVILHKSEVKKH